MRRKLTHSNRFRLKFSTNIQGAALLFATGAAIGLPASMNATAAPPLPSLEIDSTTAQTSDIILLFILEAMIKLLNEMEDIHDAQGIVLTQSDSLEDTSAALAWGYLNLGLDDNLSTFEVFDGLDNGMQALEIIQDENQILPIPQMLRDLLGSVMEDMTDDLATQI